MCIKKTALLLLMFGTMSASLTAQDWHTDLDQARQLSMEEDKPIILVFQGSDWCASCIKLDHEIWSTEEFKNYASEHYIMLKADFPKRKQNALSIEQQEKNNKLAERYNRSGYFPYVVVLNKNGDVLGNTGYKKVSPTAYIELLNSFNP